MKLYEHQKKHLQINSPKWLIADGTGVGKTVTALALAKQNKVNPLIICPKPVVLKWQETMVRMSVVGEVISREQFRIRCDTVRPYKAVIVDESHAVFGNYKSQGYKKLAHYLKKNEVEYVWLLTATPYTSNPWSLYSQANLLGHNWNFIKFRDKFFAPWYLGNRMIWEPRKGIEDELGDMVSRIGRGVTLDQCFDVPEQTFEVEHYQLTKAQERALKKIQEDESDPIVRVTKNHQIASGTLKGNEFEEHAFFDCEKNEQIVSYAEQNKKMVVFSRYNLHLQLLERMLEKKKIPCAVINGKVDDKESIFADAEKSDRFVLLVNSMISVGYELPSFPLMVFASLSYSYVDYQQALGRILRSNALKKNVYKILLTKGTVDEAVYNSVKRKEDFSEVIYSKLNNHESP